MRVRDVMGTHVITVSPGTTYEEAVKLLHEHKLSGLPVIDDGIIVGIVSEKDLFKALYPNYAAYLAYFEENGHYTEEIQEEHIESIRNTSIASYMQKKVFTVHPDMKILRAGGIMLAHGIHRLPVVEEKKLVGIVTREDIYGAILKQHLGF